VVGAVSYLSLRLTFIYSIFMKPGYQRQAQADVWQAAASPQNAGKVDNWPAEPSFVQVKLPVVSRRSTAGIEHDDILRMEQTLSHFQMVIGSAVHFAVSEIRNGTHGKNLPVGSNESTQGLGLGFRVGDPMWLCILIGQRI
jgi:hypothetical protein